MHSITNLINKSWHNPQTNILCQFYNGIFDNYLANHTSLFGYEIPDWIDSRIHKNINIIKENEYLDNAIDAVICNGIEKRDNAIQTVTNLQVPLITIFHEPIPQNFNSLPFETFVSTCQPSMKYIKYGIEETKIDFNKNRNNTVLIVNDFSPQEHDFLLHVLREFNGVLIGNNENLSSMKPTEEWHKLMEDTKVFVNLSNRQNIPYPLLYAMDRGCAVVSNLTESLDLFLNNGKNCLIGQSHEEIISHIKLLLNNEGLREELSVKGKETINREFSLSDFNENWKSLFNEIKQEIFLR